MKKILLVDGNSLLFRAYYATCYGNIMKTKSGIYTNAIFAFSNMLNKVKSELNPEAILVCFDTGKKTFRHEQFKEYKGTRKELPEELKMQFPLVREMLDCLNIPRIEIEGYEADDLIGSFAKKFNQMGDWSVEILSSDHDLLQLVNDKTTVLLTKKGITDIVKMDEAMVYEQYTLKPQQIIDLKGLMGDSSDNIPGINGIGEKTAIKLLNEFNSIEEVIANCDKLKGKLKEKIENGKEIGILSKKLATIFCDVPLEFNLEKLLIKPYDPNLAYSFYSKYEMNSLAKKLVVTTNEIKKFNYIIVDQDTNLLFDEEMALYVQTNNDNPNLALIENVYLSGTNNYVITVDQLLKNESVKNYLANNSYHKICYDAKKIENVLINNGFSISGLDFDVLLAHYLSKSHLSQELSFMAEYYGLNSVKQDDEVIGKKVKNIVLTDVYDHFIGKSNLIGQLKTVLLKNLNEQKLLDLFKIEMELSFVLAKMERDGIKVDIKILNELGISIKDKIDYLTNKIYEIAQENFNISSPKQLGSILFEKLKLPTNSKRSTNIEVLEYLADKHEIIPYIIEYRKYTKLLTTYIDGLKPYVFADSKIHTIFNQTVTQTGRLSSSEPNLQNISVKDEEGKLIRKAFIPSDENHVLLSFDYSQIELRVLAHMANGKSFIDAFNQDVDIHTKTAMDVYNVSMEQVTPLMRRQAKAVNFGIVYGISDFGLSQQLNISKKEAKEFIDNYLATYPFISEYMENIVKESEKDGISKTILNRQRYIGELFEKNYMRKEFGKRAAMNTPIQGSAADIIKLAMIKVARLFKEKNYRSKMILQVHDELIFDVDKNELDDIIKNVKLIMENVVELKVKLKVDYGYGDNWFDAK